MVPNHVPSMLSTLGGFSSSSEQTPSIVSVLEHEPCLCLTIHFAIPFYSAFISGNPSQDLRNHSILKSLTEHSCLSFFFFKKKLY